MLILLIFLMYNYISFFFFDIYFCNVSYLFILFYKIRKIHYSALLLKAVFFMLAGIYSYNYFVRYL